MAGKMLFSFAALLSFVVLAAGSRSPPDMQAVAPLALQGSADGSDDYYKCVYTLYVETGSIWKAGTDAVIGLTLQSADSSGFRIMDLVRWGGNVDVFSGRGPCLPSPPCRINVTSDGSGPHHCWYCKSVEVTATGPHARCAKAEFSVEQWLATDAPPYKLYAERSVCGKSRSGDDEE